MFPNKVSPGTAALAGASVLFAALGSSVTAQAATPGAIQAEILKVTNLGATVQIPSGDPTKSFSLTVPAATEQAKLSPAQPGDTAKLEVDDLTSPAKVLKVDQITRPVGPWPVLLAMLGSLGALFLAATIATWGRPRSFLIGADNRYSNSQFQLAMWFGAVASVYAAAVILRLLWLGWDFIGGVGVTTNVIALTGLSALTFGGAKAITGQQTADATTAGQAGKVPAAKPNFVNDLIQNDVGRADLGDFQMILITLVTVLIFLLSSFHFLMTLPVAKIATLPDIDTTLLSGFGLGQGAYLLKKAATPLGIG